MVGHRLGLASVRTAPARHAAAALVVLVLLAGLTGCARSTDGDRLRRLPHTHRTHVGSSSAWDRLSGRGGTRRRPVMRPSSLHPSPFRVTREDERGRCGSPRGMNRSGAANSVHLSAPGTPGESLSRIATGTRAASRSSSAHDAGHRPARRVDTQLVGICDSGLHFEAGSPFGKKVGKTPPPFPLPRPPPGDWKRESAAAPSATKGPRLGDEEGEPTLHENA